MLVVALVLVVLVLVLVLIVTLVLMVGVAVVTGVGVVVGVLSLRRLRVFQPYRRKRIGVPAATERTLA